MTETFNIAGYTRISVDDELDRDNVSIENQKALFVRQGHAAVQVAQPLQLEQVDQARQHGRAHTMSVGALCQIDGQLRIPVVGRALTNAVRVGITHDHAVLLADEIRKRSRRFADTVRKCLSRRHIIFKRDGCIRYVRLVNLQKRFCIP